MIKAHVCMYVQCGDRSACFGGHPVTGRIHQGHSATTTDDRPSLLRHLYLWYCAI